MKRKKKQTFKESVCDFFGYGGNQVDVHLFENMKGKLFHSATRGKKKKKTSGYL